MKTRITRDIAAARRPARPIPAALGTASWAQTEADRARIRTVLRAPTDWRASATTGVPASTTQHGDHVMRIPAPEVAAKSAPPQISWEAGGASLVLAVSAPGDALEREADQVAEQVMRMPEPNAAQAPSPELLIQTAVHRPGATTGQLRVQRKCIACGADEESCTCAPREADPSPAIAAASAAPIHMPALRSRGSPLPPRDRAFFEPRFWVDFRQVRIHTDEQAAALAHSYEAQAFTVGGHIVFAPGRYEPTSTQGRTLLAHELAHVVQQSRGVVSPGLVQRTEDWNFTPAEFGELKKNKGTLKFGPDSSWFPGPFQSNLMDTLNLILDPTRKKPATQGVNITDFFHGHIATKSKKSDELQKLTGEYYKVGEAEYSKALGGSRANNLTAKNLPAYKAAVEKTLPSAQSMLEAAAKLKDVVVIYHTFETNKPSEMKYGSPERNFITPLGGSPRGYSPPNPDSAGSWADEYTDIFQFNFLIDEKGVIHVRPGFAASSRELSTITGKPEK